MGPPDAKGKHGGHGRRSESRTFFDCRDFNRRDKEIICFFHIKTFEIESQTVDIFAELLTTRVSNQMYAQQQMVPNGNGLPVRIFRTRLRKQSE